MHADRRAGKRADTHRQMLKPENKAYLPARCAQAGPVIRPTCLRATHRQEGELEIFGVVVGRFRLSAPACAQRAGKCDAQAGKY